MIRYTACAVSLLLLSFQQTLAERPVERITNLASLGIFDISATGREQYQDILVNNGIVKRASVGHQYDEVRYEVLKKILDKFERPFTMIDLGAAQGYYSLRAAGEYPQSVFVAVEGDNTSYPHNGTQLRSIFMANTQLSNVIYLNKQIEFGDLRRLGECEHFDVVLAMNIVQHFHPRWREAAELILNLGDLVIFEVPANENEGGKKELITYLKRNGAELIGTAPRHCAKKADECTEFYLMKTNRNSIVRKSWIMPKTEQLIQEDRRQHQIDSSFSHKRLVKKLVVPCDGRSELVSDWVPGINLVTFKMYCGAYPTADQLKRSLEALRDNDHKDWQVNNMILQGQKLVMIDDNDPGNVPGSRAGVISYSPLRFGLVCKLIDIQKPRDVEDFFWYKIVGKRIMPVVSDTTPSAKQVPSLAVNMYG